MTQYRLWFAASDRHNFKDFPSHVDALRFARDMLELGGCPVDIRDPQSGELIDGLTFASK
jgi:hypothetical protein